MEPIIDHRGINTVVQEFSGLVPLKQPGLTPRHYASRSASNTSLIFRLWLQVGVANVKGVVFGSTVFYQRDACAIDESPLPNSKVSCKPPAAREF